MKEKTEIPYCSNCGEKLGVLTAVGVICSSEYIGDPLCHTCQVEHCLATNCYMCQMGHYPDCEHIELKKYYMNPED